MKRMKLLSLTLCFLLAFSPICFARGFEPGDTGGVGFHADSEHAWWSDADGNLEPGNDSTQNIGKSGLEVLGVYTDSLIVGGTTYSGTEERRVNFTVGDFIAVSTARTDGPTVRELSYVGPEPNIEMQNARIAVVWDSGVTPVQTRHTVQTGYESGGAYKFEFSQASIAGGQWSVDFDIYVNGESGNFDAAATNQTAVSIAGTTLNTVILTPATDTIKDGDNVVITVWPTANGNTGQVEFYGGYFYDYGR